MTYVYVLLQGCRYEGYDVRSVHESLEAAKDGLPNDSVILANEDWKIVQAPIGGGPVAAVWFRGYGQTTWDVCKVMP